MACALKICVLFGYLFNGMGISPNTSNVGQRPSGPMVELNEKVSMRGHYGSDILPFDSSHILAKFFLSGLWDLSTAPIDRGVLIGASISRMPLVSMSVFISSKTYEEPWNT